MRNWLSFALIWLLGSLTLAQAAPFQAGKHYVVLPAPATTQEPDKIEVAELFWYGCGHCYTLEPIIQNWKTTLPEDVHFRQVPALFGNLWNIHGQLFFTLESLGKLDEVHPAIFQAIHNQSNRLDTEKAMLEFVAPYGIEADEFKRAWGSFGVRSKMGEANRLARAYRATGVPTLIVNGKYRIEGGMVGGFEEMLKVAEFLVEQERKPTAANTPVER
ncbi:MAG: thiol:disulfide interchange protein DsbA/DsbL [Halopseudomonas yangmingensis]|uniref:Thiol:disulfide interchange protein n=1 Tax=Halopseudomonas yangmingensis TaxID=1720063 RepID=A0A1I4U358_9GAMM|nr:thiol:disulfide interchange protein DsbA/DsbL [Halopseudomonas yangmingensis]SFM83339.1 thiol:disulfide interchange protein DsbA [Halopseudomonas yangmingensis]